MLDLKFQLYLLSIVVVIAVTMSSLGYHVSFPSGCSQDFIFCLAFIVLVTVDSACSFEQSCFFDTCADPDSQLCPVLGSNSTFCSNFCSLGRFLGVFLPPSVLDSIICKHQSPFSVAVSCLGLSILFISCGSFAPCPLTCHPV